MKAVKSTHDQSLPGNREHLVYGGAKIGVISVPARGSSKKGWQYEDCHPVSDI
jgi:hypothetical protein